VSTMTLFRPPGPMRRLILAVGLVVLSIAASGSAGADAVAVPVSVQAELLVKVAAYDKNFAKRAVDRVRVFIVEKRDDGDSVRVASQLRSALQEVGRIAGLPHEETIVDFSSAAALAAGCRAGHASIVYLGPGLDSEVDGIGKALEGGDLLSVGSVPEYVAHGIVLGFGLRSGKPKMLVNLTQAMRQGVDFRADVLRLMTVVQ